jgi:hypothetical protein
MHISLEGDHLVVFDRTRYQANRFRGILSLRDSGYHQEHRNQGNHPLAEKGKGTQLSHHSPVDKVILLCKSRRKNPRLIHVHLPRRAPGTNLKISGASQVCYCKFTVNVVVSGATPATEEVAVTVTV